MPIGEYSQMDKHYTCVTCSQLKTTSTIIDDKKMALKYFFLEHQWPWFCFILKNDLSVLGRPPEKRTRNFSAYLLFYQRVPVGGLFNKVSSLPCDIIGHHSYQRTQHFSESSFKLRPSVVAFLENQIICKLAFHMFIGDAIRYHLL